eukprot:608617-Rhodomonas_salina.1
MARVCAPHALPDRTSTRREGRRACRAQQMLTPRHKARPTWTASATLGLRGWMDRRARPAPRASTRA